MKDFVNPYANMKQRVKPWFQLRPEETSYIIYNAYRMHFLKSEDVSRFKNLHRLQMATFYAFPVLAFFPIKTVIESSRFSYRRFNPQILLVKSLTSTAFAWWTFSKISPFRSAYEKEKLKILDYLDANMGITMLNFNNMLPRHWTENWVNGYTSKLYRQRNSKLTGWLYPFEGVTNTIYSSDEFPITNEGGY